MPTENQGYVLLVDYDIDSPEPFEKMLAVGEAPRGVLVTLKFEAENVGQQAFPGGRIAALYVHQFLTGTESYFGTDKTEDDLKTEVPPLQPGESRGIFDYPYLFSLEGLTEIGLKIISNDGISVSYRKRKDGSDIEEWPRYITVINKEQILTVHLLEQLIEAKREKEAE